MDNTYVRLMVSKYDAYLTASPSCYSPPRSFYGILYALFLD